MIKQNSLLKKILKFSQKKKVKLYIVGGYLRDKLINRQKPNPDIDFCLKDGAINFARKLGRELKAGFVVLDKEHGSCRIVKKIEDKIYTLDFTDFRGRNLNEDLLHRDFSINALSLELGSIFTAQPEKMLLDPYQGRSDLKNKLIRALNPRTFDEDPLRILRAFSLTAIFNFKIEPSTLRLIKLKKDKLKAVSYERIRDELFKILNTHSSFYYLNVLSELKILKIILPEIESMRGIRQGPYHHLDVLGHSLKTLDEAEKIIKELKNNFQIQDYLGENISSERKRYTLLKLAALLHDIGKPLARRRQGRKIIFHGHERIGLEIAENIAKRLKLSNDEVSSLRKMVLWHLRPGYLADNAELTPRAIFRYFRDTQEEAVSTLLVSLADQRATRGRLTSKESRLRHEKLCFSLVKEYFRRKKEKKLPRLINGDILIKEFKLQPSPLIGKILREVEELQAIGRVRTREEALKAARKIVNG